MEEKKVVKKKRVVKKVSRAKKTPMPKPEPVNVRGPGKVERALMCIETILKALLKYVGNRIKMLKTRRLAKRMDGDGTGRI